MTALSWAAMRAILMFHNCEGQSQKTVSTDHNFWSERRAEAGSKRDPSIYQPNALQLGQNGSRKTKKWREKRKKKSVDDHDVGLNVLGCRAGAILVVVEVLLYVHRNRRLIRDGSPGRSPRLLHSSWVQGLAHRQGHLMEDCATTRCAPPEFRPLPPRSLPPLWPRPPPPNTSPSSPLDPPTPPPAPRPRVTVMLIAASKLTLNKTVATASKARI